MVTIGGNHGTTAIMTTRILDGRAISQRLRAGIAEAAADSTRAGVVPVLATVVVGEHPASLSYVLSKQRACAELGIHAEDVRLAGDIEEAHLLRKLAELNDRPDIHGILVQQPLPPHMDEERVVAGIVPEKDVDGFHPVNLGRLLRGQKCFVPCTPLGIVRMFEEADVTTTGKRVVVVGRSLLVGKPVAILLMRKGEPGNATVTVCHSATRDIASITSKADILIAAMGRPRFITAEMVQEGAVVVDVGINRIDDPSTKRGYRLVGDVDYDSVAPRASLITPVPGGVGPMTVTMLLFNTVQAARGRSSFDPLKE